MKRFAITKKLNIFAIIIALLLSLTMSACSGNRYWRGVDINGVITSDKNCPIEVEKEYVTFDIPKLPYADSHDYIVDPENEARVSVEYHFYNPTEQTVTVPLAFPWGSMDEYTSIDFNDKDKYTVQVNGGEIDKSIRYTYYNGEFDKDLQLSRLKDDFISDGLYSPDTIIRSYTYYPLRETCTITGDLKDVSDGSLFFVYGDHYTNEDDGSYCFDVYGGKFTVYVLGDEIEMPEWNVYSYGNMNVGYGCCQDPVVVTQTLKEFILKDKPNEQISDMDYFNATIDRMREGDNYLKKNVRLVSYLSLLSRRLMGWYCYDLQLLSGQRVINTISAPLYPDISRKTCRYNFILSSLHDWADFKYLSVKIVTPFYLTSSTCTLNQYEFGYSADFDRLPERDISFSLSEEEPQESTIDTSKINKELRALIIGVKIGVVIAILIPTVLLVVLIVVTVKALKKKK